MAHGFFIGAITLGIVLGIIYICNMMVKKLGINRSIINMILVIALMWGALLVAVVSCLRGALNGTWIFH